MPGFIQRTSGYWQRASHLGRTLAGIGASRLAALWRHADLAVFHEFVPPPTGGGHQFLRALCGEFRRRRLCLESNIVSPTTRACLFNSYNFDLTWLRSHRRSSCRMVHRVDGPIGTYRGTDSGVDQRIAAVNAELADATIFQSQYSRQKHLEMGFRFANPVVIPNAADPSLFHASGRIGFDRRRKMRLISTCWSNNPNKGTATYQWLDRHLDWSRFEYTYVGRSPVSFERIRSRRPVASRRLAELLRAHDVFITASQNDPCSNALVEALSCGLPVIYLKSGGHPELVKEGGFPFEHAEQVPELLDRLEAEYEPVQSRVAAPRLSAVADDYLRLMGLRPAN